MKFQLSALTALALSSQSNAFTTAPAFTRSSTSMMLEMSSNNNNSEQKVDFGTQAMSTIAAGLITASALGSTFVLPPMVEPAYAKTTTTVQQVDPKEAAKLQKAKAEAEKAAFKKLSPEERNKITAKKNLDLAEQTLKEYTKYLAESKGYESKLNGIQKAAQQ